MRLQKIKRISHENLLSLKSEEMYQSTCYLLLEDVQWNTMADYVKKIESSVKEAPASKYMLQLLNGLAHLHSHGVVHGNITCENLLLDDQSNVKLCGFAVERALEERLARASHSTAGKSCNKSPEEMNGEDPSETSDIWKAGCVLFQMTAGHALFAGLYGERLANAVKECKIPEISSATPELKNILGMIFVHKDDRPPAEALKSHTWFETALNTTEADPWGSVTAADGQRDKEKEIKDFLSKCKQQKVLGTGQYGQVVSVVHEEGEKRAAKIFRNEEADENLNRELSWSRKLLHKNIVKCYGHAFLDHWNTHENVWILLMELMKESLRHEILATTSGLETARTRHYTHQILEGLQYIHSCGLVHRDIKGFNLLVDGRGGIKIGDLGFIKKLENHGTVPIASRPEIGTERWMSPEAIIGKNIGTKTDVWSLGCTVVEMLTKLPPEAPSKVITDFETEMDIPRKMPPEVQDFLRQTFIKDHRKRPCVAHLLFHSWVASGDRGQI